MPLQDRRTFLATLGAAVGAARLGRFADARPAARAKKLKKVGLQLYTVRNEMRRDVAGTLAAVATAGYDEVEFAGYFDKSATEIRDLLKENKLTAPSTHLGLEAINQKAFDDAKVIGHEWITLPSLPRGQRTTVDDWKRVAEQFNQVAATVKAAGLRFAFHNHNAELRKVGDAVPLEVLIKETDPSLVSFQMDIYWVVNGGGDPIDLLTRYAKRFRMVHVKDSMGPPDHKMVSVGEGTIDFKTILARCEKNGVEHYFVEHDNPADPMASIKASAEYLRRLEI